jgi:hypothetical protein
LDFHRKPSIVGNSNYTYVGVTNRLNTLTHRGGYTVNYTYFENLEDKRVQHIKNLTSTSALLRMHVMSSTTDVYTIAQVGLARIIVASKRVIISLQPVSETYRVRRGAFLRQLGRLIHGFQHMFIDRPRHIAVLNFVSLILLACMLDCSQPDENEVKGAVLSQGQIVEATNKNGTVKISYVNPIERKYVWNGKSRVVKMIPRREPFQGKLGVYEAADSSDINQSETRLVVDESVREFENEEQVKSALMEGGAIMDWTYTDDGLVVGFAIVPSRNQVNIDLYQFLIRGQKPIAIPGARPDRIRMAQSR